MKNYFTLLFLSVFTLTTLQSQIVISEISYNPPESGTDTLEYLEIHNAGDTVYSLNGHKIAKGITFSFPDTTIAAGAYIIVAKNTNSFLNAYGLQVFGWSADPLSTSNALNNTGELVELVDDNGVVKFAFTYAKILPWPGFTEGTDGGGRSIEICHPLADPNNGENWKVSQNDLGFQINGRQIFGTPGSANSIASCTQEPDIIVEVSSNVFTPKDITIEVGQTVRWINKGGEHNVNGSTSVFPGNPESFTNGPTSSSLWTYDYTFTIAGVYNYRCDLHFGLGMVGTVTVQSPVVIDLFPARNIPDVTKVNADGVPDSINVSCTLKGIVYGVNLRPAGLQFTIIDANNNGIGAFSNSSNYEYVVKEGDEVEIKGTIAQFNGFTQMTLNGVKKLSENNPLLSPKIVTDFVEDDESSLITLKNLTFVNPGDWTGAGSGFNMTMTDGSKSFTIRIDNDIDAFSQPIPSGTLFNVTGLLGQFDANSPYMEGYQLLPRYLLDFESVSGVIETNHLYNLTATPNPVCHTLYLINGEVPQKITIYNDNGQALHSYANTNEIDMTGFNPGLFIIKAYNQHLVKIIKVIKL